MILPTTDRAAPTSAPVWPAPAEAAELFQRGELVPVYSTQLADLETPVSVYLKLRQLGGASFLTGGLFLFRTGGTCDIANHR